MGASKSAFYRSIETGLRLVLFLFSKIAATGSQFPFPSFSVFSYPEGSISRYRTEHVHGIQKVKLRLDLQPSKCTVTFENKFKLQNLNLNTFGFFQKYLNNSVIQGVTKVSMIEVCNRVFLSFFLIYIVTSVCPLTPTTTANTIKRGIVTVDFNILTEEKDSISCEQSKCDCGNYGFKQGSEGNSFNFNNFNP